MYSQKLNVEQLQNQYASLICTKPKYSPAPKGSKTQSHAMYLFSVLSSATAQSPRVSGPPPTILPQDLETALPHFLAF